MAVPSAGVTARRTLPARNAVRVPGRLLLLVTLAACATPPEAQRSEGPRDRACAFEGMTLHYLDAGAGERTLVLVHGWGGSAAVWRHSLRDLAAHARVLAVDLPGHGASAAPRIDYTVALLARSIAAVLDDAGRGRAVLVGHSNAGSVVRTFQRMYPERTAGLVLVEAPLRGFLTQGQAEELAAPLLAPGGEMAAARMADAVVASAPPEHRDEIRGIASGTPLHVLHSTLIAGNLPELWTDDPIPVPVLAVHAEAPYWDDAYEAYVRKLCPDLDYQVWQSVGHFPMLDRPARFHVTLRDFLSRIGADR